MTTIAANLQAVHARISAACSAARRPPESVRLIAVGKTWPAACLREVAACGQRLFAESYAREGVEKIRQLADLPLEWHFIGPLQSNKTRLIAEHFAWAHALDRLKIAERLAAQRPASLPPLQVCLQVNVSGEASKSGCTPEEVPVLARAVVDLPGLRLRGLMTIPEPTDDVALQRRRFAVLRELLEDINARFGKDGLTLDTLSMGMSHDLEAAILEGATMVRIGSAIFGQRRP